MRRLALLLLALASLFSAVAARADGLVLAAPSGPNIQGQCYASGSSGPRVPCVLQGQIWTKVLRPTDDASQMTVNGRSLAGVISGAGGRTTLTPDAITGADVSGTKVLPSGSTTTNTLSALLGRTVYITDFMAPGSTDITVALPAAVAKLATTGGGKLVIPPAPTCYTLSAPYTLTTNNITIEGDNRFASCIQSTFQGDVLKLGDGVTVLENSIVRGLGFRSSIGRTSGAAISMASNFGGIVSDVSCDVNAYICIDIPPNQYAYKQYIVRLNTPAGGVVGVRIGAGANGVAYPASWNIIDSEIGGASRAAIEINNTGGGTIVGGGTLLANNGLLMNPGTGQRIFGVFSVNHAIDTSVNEGLKIVPIGTGSVADIMFSNLWVASGSGTGILIGPGTGARSIQFSNPHVINNGGHGFDIQGGLYLDVVNAQIGMNSRAASNTYSGIRVAPGVSNFSFTGGRSGPGTTFVANTNPQKYGVQIDAGSSDKFTLQMDLSGNVTGALLNGATGASQTIISRGAPYAFTGANVGIGTSQPYSPLSVASVSRPYTEANAGNGQVQVTTGTGALADDGIRLGVSSGAYGWMQCSQPGVAQRPCYLNPNGGGLLLGKVGSSPTATDGLPYVSSMAGTPTAAPPAITGGVPITIDTTNGKLCAYVGSAWKCATLN